MEPERARELLARERARVERALAELSPDGRDEELSHADQHPADEATQVFEEERDAGMAIDLREALAAIERAERRLADGSFGRSIESGEPIPDERLEAHPTAERTVEEESALGRRR